MSVVRLGGARAEIIDSDGGASLTSPLDVSADPSVIRIDIIGPIEQRAGYHDVCAGWSDGHDAIAERMCAALSLGDVLLVVDSPGGAAAGLQEAVRRVVAAKAEHGRRVTGYVDEMCASAALWWVASVCDEIYLPEAGLIGSIGARGMHVSVAGALAKDGLAPTAAVWPGQGKVALAPEFPLSETGRARMDRDVAIAGEAFASAMVAARKGLTRDAIVELDADCLTGEAAVTAHLADGVATYEEVLAMALAHAGSTGDQPMKIKSEGEPSQVPSGAGALATRAEGDPPADAPPAEDAGMQPSPDCAGCGMRNAENAKFCNQCGGSMAAKRTAEDPPADAPKAPPPAGPPAKPAPPPPDSHASIASLAGLESGASTPAIKAALIPFVDLAHEVMRVTESASPRQAAGKFRALADNAAKFGEASAALVAAEKRESWGKRMGLVMKLSAANLPGYPRGDLLVDSIDATSGARTVAPAKMYAEMNLDTLEGFVTSKLAGAPERQRAPWEPDPLAARAITDAGVPDAPGSAEQFTKMSEHSTSTPEQLRASHAALRQMGAIQ